MPIKDNEAYLAHVAAIAKSKQGASPKRNKTGGLKKTFDNMSESDKVEIVLEDRKGKKNEFLVEAADPRHEAVQRRRAYDAHLKTDILYSGRENSMNATFDPYFYNNAYWNGHGYYPHGWHPAKFKKRNEEIQSSPNT